MLPLRQKKRQCGEKDENLEAIMWVWRKSGYWVDENDAEFKCEAAATGVVALEVSKCFLVHSAYLALAQARFRLCVCVFFFLLV